MRRRAALRWLAAGVALTGGCAGPGVEVTEHQTGEIDVAFRTEASESYRIRLRVEDGDGPVVDEFDSEIPPGRTPGPSFYSGGLSGGPFTVTVQTEVDRASFEWSIEDCPSLDVEVTVGADGTLAVDRTCSPVETRTPPPGDRTRRG